MLDLKNNKWESTPDAEDFDRTNVIVENVSLGNVESEKQPKKVAVFVTLTDSADRTAFDRMVSESGDEFAAAEILSVTTSAQIDPREGARLSQTIAQNLKRLSANHGRAEIHLAFHGPLTLAVLVGRLLNTLRTVVYEWDLEPSGKSAYKPALSIEPGVTGGPITEVLLENQ